METWLSEYRVDLAFYSYQDNIKHEWIPLKKDPLSLIHILIAVEDRDIRRDI